MLGPSIIYFGTPFALGYSARARRRLGGSRVAATAFGLAVLECVALTVLVIGSFFFD